MLSAGVNVHFPVGILSGSCRRRVPATDPHSNPMRTEISASHSLNSTTRLALSTLWWANTMTLAELLDGVHMRGTRCWREASSFLWSFTTLKILAPAKTGSNEHIQACRSLYRHLKWEQYFIIKHLLLDSLNF